MAFRCISIREKELKRNKDRLAIVRSAQNSNIILGPNETINILGYTDKEIDHHQTCAILQETEESNIPAYIDVTPTVIQYNNKRNTEVSVNSIQPDYQHSSNLTKSNYMRASTSQDRQINL